VADESVFDSILGAVAGLITGFNIADVGPGVVRQSIEELIRQASLPCAGVTPESEEDETFTSENGLVKIYGVRVTLLVPGDGRDASRLKPTQNRREFVRRKLANTTLTGVPEVKDVLGTHYAEPLGPIPNPPNLIAQQSPFVIYYRAVEPRSL
jgi:hypothetical protein